MVKEIKSGGEGSLGSSRRKQTVSYGNRFARAVGKRKIIIGRHMKEKDVKRGREKGMEAVAESGGPKQQDEETMIAFFDVETTVPFHSGPGGDGYSLLEFGAILVCPRRLIEVENFSTLVRPTDLNSISPQSISCNGITRDSASTAPYFAEVADKVFSFLHGIHKVEFCLFAPFALVSSSLLNAALKDDL